MAGYVTLMGAESVQSAGYAMRQAAEEMNRAASGMQEAVHEQRRILDNFLIELRDIIDEAKKGGPA
jgi:hypothetical protein